MVASVSALTSSAQAASYYEADDYYAEGGYRRPNGRERARRRWACRARWIAISSRICWTAGSAISSLALIATGISSIDPAGT